MNAMNPARVVIPEVDSARVCLRDAIRRIHELWPVTEANDWAGDPPPPEIVDALGLLTVAAGHLANLEEFGPTGFHLTPRS